LHNKSTTIYFSRSFVIRLLYVELINNQQDLYFHQIASLLSDIVLLSMRMLVPIAKLTSGLATVVTTVVARNANTFHNVVGTSTNMKAAPAMIASVAAESITANSSMSSSILPLLYNLRGGAAAAAGVAIDFQRENFVLQGMATYV
jgi:hypothetical protein